MKPKYEREIEEILQKLGVEDRRPSRWRLLWNRLTFNLRFQASRVRVPPIEIDARGWLVASVILAVSALLLRSLVDPVVARLAAVAAALCFFAPIVARGRAEEARYWRGRDLYRHDQSLDIQLTELRRRLRSWWQRIRGRF